MFVALAAVSAIAQASMISVSDVYTEGDNIVATFVNTAPWDQADQPWIGIYPKDQMPKCCSSSTAYSFLCGGKTFCASEVSSGTQTYNASTTQLNRTLSPGFWTIYLFTADSGYNWTAAKSFEIQPAATGASSISTNKAKYDVGEDIVTTFTNGQVPVDPTSWVGIYPRNQMPKCCSSSTAWQYLCGGQTGCARQDGSLTFNAASTQLGRTLSPGQWTAYLFREDVGYQWLAASDFTIEEEDDDSKKGLLGLLGLLGLIPLLLCSLLLSLLLICCKRNKKKGEPVAFATMDAGCAQPQSCFAAAEPCFGAAPMTACAPTATGFNGCV